MENDKRDEGWSDKPNLKELSEAHSGLEETGWCEEEVRWH